MKKHRLTLQNFLLIPWILFFAVILFTGSYRYYVASFQLWTISAGLIFMVIFFFYDLLIQESRENGTHNHNPHQHEHSQCSHETNREEISFSRGWIHFIPLFLFFVVGPQELTTQVAEAKDPFVGYHGDRSGTDAEFLGFEEIDTDTYDVLTFEESDIRKLYSEKKFRTGNYGVIVEGLVYKPSESEIPSELRTGSQSVLLLHFVMVCCAADCTPKVLLLRKVDSNTVEENTWMKIWGVTSCVGKQKDIIMLNVLKFEKLKKPTYPYLIP